MSPNKVRGRRSGNSSDNPDRIAPKKGLRDKSKIKLLNTYRMGKAKHDRDGKVVGGYLRSDDKSGNKEITGMARIEPNRKWFGNTRTIGAEQLDKFREEVTKTSNDPYASAFHCWWALVIPSFWRPRLFLWASSQILRRWTEWICSVQSPSSIRLDQISKEKGNAFWIFTRWS